MFWDIINDFWIFDNFLIKLCELQSKLGTFNVSISFNFLKSLFD